MSSIQGAKAISAVTRGDVREVEHARVFEVPSSNERCTNPNHAGWSHYGGRGISVCERWLAFENFLADMGERPVGRTLDRIDSNGNYEPANCRWATAGEQTANRRPRHNGLTRRDVVEVHRAWAEWPGSKKQFAREQAEARGVTDGQIKHILAGRCWRDVYMEVYA